MIFVTVGTQLPFDRLIKYVDQFAAAADLKVLGQIGKGKYEPENIRWKRFYEPDEMDEAFKISKVIVSHAGMGTIINCLRIRKPIIIFPRLSALGEHRNDHQLDTLKSFENVAGIYSAKDENQLCSLLQGHESLSLPKGLDSSEKVGLCNYVMSQL